MLTDSQIRSAKRGERPRKLGDGGGLYLLVPPNGGRYWRFNYRFAGKQKTLKRAASELGAVGRNLNQIA